MDDARRVIERVARESYGRLVAYLAARTRDVSGVEDALADAFVAALRTWPRDGVPEKPEAWLLTAARRRLIDRLRHDHVRADASDTLQLLAGRSADAPASETFPDERLKLLFVCAHPAIDAAVHTPLMLQVVLGLDAAAIAHAFLVQPATMGQRLSRAKTKIRDAGIPFDIPDRRDLPSRLEAVLNAIYAAYGTGWDEVAGTDSKRRGLTEEAVWLARVLLSVLPDEPEAQGLLALMLYCEARRGARRGPGGEYVPMSAQDPRLWSVPMIREAEQLLTAAALAGRPQRYQLEAALQSAHVERAIAGRTDWHAVAALYEALVRVSPTVGALIGRAAAVAEAAGSAAGLALLDAIDPAFVAGYQPYWAVRAHLLSELARPSDANAAFNRAIALTEDEAIRRFLLERRGGVAGGHMAS